MCREDRMPGVIIRVAECPGLLERELPRPGGGQLTVPIERRSFHRSPGARFFRCPACGELRGVLVEVVTADQHPGWRAAREHPAAQALGWACRRCAGLPHSRAWPLWSSDRLANALARAADLDRQHGEKARDWRRRRGRAQAALIQAAADERAAERIAAEALRELL